MSIKFSIPNAATKVDWAATSVSDGGATIPVVNKPSFSAVAGSGAYADLTGKPTFATVATSGKYTDLTATPAFATVATSGKYTDLTAQPTIPSKLSQLTNDTLAVTGISTFSGPTNAANGMLVTGPVQASAQTFPVNAMTSNSQDGFVISASSVNSQAGVNQTYYAFDRTANRWASSSVAANAYSGSGGTAYTGTTTTTVGGTSVAGEWIQLQSPTPYKLVSYSVADVGPREKSWTLAGSQDGTSWYLLDSQNLQSPVAATVSYNTPSVTAPFTYFRFIVQTVTGFTVTDLNELLFSGLPYSAGSLNVAGKLTVTVPSYWKYNLTTSLSLSANSASRPPSSSWTLSNPTATSNIMDATGYLVVPVTGVYAVTMMYYFSAASGHQVWMPTNDSALGNIIFQTNQNTQTVGQLSWTGRIPAGTLLTPAYQSTVADTLLAEAAPSRYLNAITLVQLC